jgi:integrase
MPRPAKGPRLYRRKRYGREIIWVIRDGDYEESTGCAESDVRGAEEALEIYLTRKRKRGAVSSRPAEIMIADVLNLYAKNVAPEARAPDALIHAVETLAKWWGEKKLSEVRGSTCRAYVDWRAGKPWAKAKRSTRTVTKSTARRDLQTLQAAINHYHQENTLDAVPVVTLPEKSPARDRWLNRSEAARLLWSALREPKARHLARFILIGLYTGTRHRAILGLHWLSNTRGGWFDVDAGLMYRRAVDERETKKRKPPARIPKRLHAHLRRWRRMDAAQRCTVVVHYHGEPIKKERRAWHTARARAGLGPEVTPHVMRHTAATWLMQRRCDLWEAAGFLGMTPEMLRDVYGHHHPDFQKEVANAY